MNSKEKLADYVLVNRSAAKLPDLGISLISEGYDSSSLNILAGMNEKDNVHEIIHYFDASIRELTVIIPSKIEAARILLTHYLNAIVNTPTSALKIMRIVDNQIYDSTNWVKELKISDTDYYLGEELGLHKLYSWYGELQDHEGPGLTAVYTDNSGAGHIYDLQSELIKEAQKWLDINNP
jgi:hypothetical protein